MRTRRLSCLLGLLAVAGAAQALEVAIGAPQRAAGMELAAVYVQPIEMAPAGHMRAPADSDIHLEADIRALEGNANGFAAGAWIPYLQVRYELTKQGGGAPIAGPLMPMVASDGPHYGDNVKLAGPGKYRLRIVVAPPAEAPHAALGRHTDRATGVQPWFKPITLEREFVFAGAGKKGGY